MLPPCSLNSYLFVISNNWSICINESVTCHREALAFGVTAGDWAWLSCRGTLPFANALLLITNLLLFMFYISGPVFFFNIYIHKCMSYLFILSIAIWISFYNLHVCSSVLPVLQDVIPTSHFLIAYMQSFLYCFLRFRSGWAWGWEDFRLEMAGAPWGAPASRQCPGRCRQLKAGVGSLLYPTRHSTSWASSWQWNGLLFSNTSPFQVQTLL